MPKVPNLDVPCRALCMTYPGWPQQYVTTHLHPECRLLHHTLWPQAPLTAPQDSVDDPMNSTCQSAECCAPLAAQLSSLYLCMQGPVHELTIGSLADVVYTANIPLLGILANADPRGDHHFLQTAIKAATEVLDRNDTTGLFMRRTVEVRNPQGCKRHGDCLHHTGVRAPDPSQRVKAAY